MPSRINTTLGPNTTVPRGIGLGLNLLFSWLEMHEFGRARAAIRDSLQTAVSRLSGPGGVGSYVAISFSTRQIGNDVRSYRRFIGATVSTPLRLTQFVPPNFIAPPDIRYDHFYVYNANFCPFFADPPPISMSDARDLIRRLS